MATTTLASGLSLNIDVQGEGEPLLLISGLTADLSIWDIVASQLRKQFRVIRFDNRGAGKSDSSDGPYSLEVMARDTIELMDSLGVERAAIVGHSMGGAILQQICLTDPSRVSRAIIVASSATLPYSSRLHIRGILALREAQIDNELVLTNIVPWMYSEATLRDHKMLERLKRSMRTPPTQRMIETFRQQISACEQEELPEKISNIKTPTLVVGADEDRITPLSCSEFIHQKIANSTLEVIPSCGHMVQAEQPEKLVTLIAQYVRGRE